MNWKLWLTKAKARLPHHLHYIPLHFAFFVIFSLLGGLIIQRIEGNINYADALFTATSACCVTGLSTLDTSTLKPGSQVAIFLWLLVGSAVLFSVLPVLIRGYFYRRFIRANQNTSSIVELEFLALKKLMWIVPLYYVCNIVFIFILLVIYNTSGTKLPDARDVNPAWASLFLAGSSFANAGFSLFADNLIGYQRHPFVLFVLMYAILAGNTAFPLFLWCIIQIRRKFLSRWIENDTEVYDYLIEHPRRCFTHLFPARSSLWLLCLLIAFNLIQFGFAAGFNWNRPTLSGLGSGLKLINSLFQSISTRTAGFNSVDISSSNPGILVLTLVMMYVSSYPVVLTLRSSREEAWEVEDTEEDQAERKDSSFAEKRRSLQTSSLPPSHTNDDSTSIRKNSLPENENAHAKKQVPPKKSEIEIAAQKSFRGQARKLFLRDAAIVFVGYFIVALIEADHYYQNPLDYNLFKIFFEVVSAFGTVGLSLGFPNSVLSFSGKLHNGSKLILVIVMLFGRHRGLPDILDSAIVFDSAKKRNLALKHRQMELKSRRYYDDEESRRSLQDRNKQEMKEKKEEEEEEDRGGRGREG